MSAPTSSQQYLFALVAIASTFLLRFSVDPLLNGHPTLVVPLAGVLIAAWYGGLKPGLLGAGLSTALVLILLEESPWRLRGSEPQAGAAIVVYAVVASVSAVLIARLRTTTDQLKQKSQEVERASELLLAAQKASQSGVWAWEPGTDYVYWSCEHYHLYGIPEATSVSVQQWIEAIHPDDRPAVRTAFDGCKTSPQRLDVEFRVHRDLKTVWCRLVGDVVGHSPVRLAGITINVTHQKTMELELKRSNEDLDSFAHVVSHDLREPLRMVTSYAQLIERRHGASLGQDGTQFLRHILNGAQRMQQLVEALLALSSANHRGAQQNQPVDLNTVICSVVDSLQRITTTTGASITWDHLPTVRGNDVVLAQVFQNLIENAIKYRCPDESPRIRIETRSREGLWEIEVKDNGIGFSMEYANKLFTPFRRLHAAHQYEGTGIGLATCKRSVERLGGRIEARSEPGKGSVFTIFLPAAEMAEEQGEGTERAEGAGGGRS